VLLAKAQRECGKRETCMAKMKEMFLKSSLQTRLEIPPELKCAVNKK
jgi:hypothetical protein